MPHHRGLTERIIGLAASAHRSGAIGIVLCRRLLHELEQAGIPIRRQVGSPAIYQGKPLPLGYRADILADETVILEIKAVGMRAELVGRPRAEQRLSCELIRPGAAFRSACC